MEQIYIDFCEYLVNKKKSSVNTLASYKRDIQAFIVYLQNKEIKKFSQVDNKLIHTYISYLKRKSKSESTISRNLSSLRCFFKYLVLKKKITFNPMIGVKNIKITRKLPEVLNSYDVELLLKQPDISTPKGMRDKAMLEVLYATGIRVSELIGINLSDVNIEVGCIIINHGTPKERIVPLYHIAINALNEYINHGRTSFVTAKNKNPKLFLNVSGNEMTRQGFWKIIKSYAAQAGVNGEITPKILRHSFATHLLENGADINILKDMLGHSALASTRVYTKVLKNKYLSVYESCHPRAKQK